MVEITGEKTPLLFDKWKPASLHGFSGESGEEGQKLLDFTYIFHNGFVEFCYNSLQCHIQGSFPSMTLELKERYSPELLEMFKDAKTYASHLIKGLSAIHDDFGRVSVDKISWFGRIVNLCINIDYNKAGLRFEDSTPQAALAKGIYERLEQKLKERHGFSKDLVQPGWLMDFMEAGDEKRIWSPEGLHFISTKYSCENPFPGLLYLKLVGDHTAVKQKQEAVLSDIISEIECHHEVLQEYDGRFFDAELKENGTYWQIDLRQIKFPKRLTERAKVEQKLLEFFSPKT
ncbi:MAG: hypothetical protein V1837_05160 [Candidatus Woesearchaeota archaeon]